MGEIQRENLNDLQETESFIRQKTKKELAALKTEIQESIMTVEETDSTVTWTFGSKIDFAWLKGEVNLPSYESLMKSMSFEELKAFYSKIDSIARKNNLDSDWKSFSFNPFNIGELKDAFTKAWYKADGGFWGEEMSSLIQLVENVYKTQAKLNKSQIFQNKLGVIFDYNQDWLLDDKVNFVTEEKQIFEAIKTERDFENLLKNMGYSSKAEFDKAFHNNYFQARAEFKERLGTLLLAKDTLNPWEMIKDAEAVKKFEQERLDALKIEIEAKDEVDKMFETNKNLKKLPEDTKKLIKLQAIWVLVGSSMWVWASFDIKEATHKILDSLAFGFIDWVPWIWVAKELYKSDNWRLTVNAWVVNFVPIISASWVLKEGDVWEFKKLFPNEIDKSTKVTLIGWLSPVWGSVWFDITKISEKTKAWIELSKKKMSEILDKVFEDIKAWKTFDQSSFTEEPSNKLIYERLASMYKSNWWHIDQLKEWALKNYERALYQNAEWYQFTGGWAWLLFIAGFLPVPILLIHWEKHNTDWEWKDTFVWKKSVKKQATESKTTRTEKITEKVDYMKSGFESKWDLNTKLESIKDAFSWKTRYNKWALKFMDPSNDLNTRWEWLEQLAKNVKALKKVDLKWLMSTIKTPEEKWTVISTLSQYMKKANDFDNWSIDSWNQNKDKFIKIDKERRKNFDGMFGFSLNEEADKYYSELKKAQGKIGETKVQWISFDATSSKNVEGKSIKWIDALYTNISILTVDSKPLLIPITDSSKIEAFKKTISLLPNLSQEIKKDLIAWIDNWTVELNYYKDPEGFNDRILPRIKTKEVEVVTTVETPKLGETPYINVYNPVHSTLNLVWAWVWDRQEDKEEPKEEPKEETKEPPKNPPKNPPKEPPKEPPEEPEEWDSTTTPDQDIVEIPESWEPITNVNTPIPVAEPTTPVIEDPGNTWRPTT